MRHVRDSLRRRLLLVKQRTAQLLSLQSMIGRHTGLRLSSHQVKQLKHEDLAHYFESAITRFAAQQSQQLMQQIKLQIEAIEDFVLACCEESEQYARITTHRVSARYWA